MHFLKLLFIQTKIVIAYPSPSFEALKTFLLSLSISLIDLLPNTCVISARSPYTFSPRGRKVSFDGPVTWPVFFFILPAVLSRDSVSRQSLDCSFGQSLYGAREWRKVFLLCFCTATRVFFWCASISLCWRICVFVYFWISVDTLLWMYTLKVSIWLSFWVSMRNSVREIKAHVSWCFF